ncbi:hypothetical protein [Geodermatophilus sp. SYSU D01105]
MTRATAAVQDFTLLLPPGWARIPLDDRVPLRVKQLVDERLSTVPAEHREALRTGLTRDLGETLTAARSRGGLDVLLSLDPVAGMPVPASALVTHLQGDGADLAGLLETLSSGGDDVTVQELDLVEVAGAPAVRRLGVHEERVDPVGELPGGVLRVTRLDYYVPIPGSHGILVFAFSTPVEQLGPALVGLFDVMATSMRWVRA